jgi:hypothetical protein
VTIDNMMKLYCPERGRNSTRFFRTF